VERKACERFVCGAQQLYVSHTPRTTDETDRVIRVALVVECAHRRQRYEDDAKPRVCGNERLPVAAAQDDHGERYKQERDIAEYEKGPQVQLYSLTVR